MRWGWYRLGLPHTLHSAQADDGRLGEHARRSMRRLPGRLAGRRAPGFWPRPLPAAGFYRAARRITQQALDALLGEALLPTRDRRPAALAWRATPDRQRSADNRRSEPLNVLLRRWIADNCSQSCAILVAEKNTDVLCHARIIAWLDLMSVLCLRQWTS